MFDRVHWSVQSICTDACSEDSQCIVTDGCNQKFQLYKLWRHRGPHTQLPDYHVGTFNAPERWLEGYFIYSLLRHLFPHLILIVTPAYPFSSVVIIVIYIVWILLPFYRILKLQFIVQNGFLSSVVLAQETSGSGIVGCFWLFIQIGPFFLWQMNDLLWISNA